MFKFAIVIFALIAYAAAKPGLIGGPLVYKAHAAVITAPAPLVTATSSQVIARNHNGIASAPIVAHVSAPVVAAPLASVHTAPVVANYAASPLAYSSPLTYSSPLAYSAPLTYAAAPAPVLW